MHISRTSEERTGLSRMLLLCGVLAATALGLPLDNTAHATELWIGADSVDITPSGPVAVSGQMYLRITKKVESPVTANVVVLESRRDERLLDVAVMVSCDLLVIPQAILEMTRQVVHERLPDLDTRKIFLSATHTHTGPCVRTGIYKLPNTGVMQVEAYQKFLAERIASAIEKAWKTRKPGGVSWGLGHAVVAYNRRLVYADGSAKMCGPTMIDNFRRVEGREDQGVEVLFFWDESKKLIATVVNAACPAQEIGTNPARTASSRNVVSADFWHEVREKLHEKHGKDLCVLAWCGAAGDQCPWPEWRTKGEERMRKALGLTRLEEIARRIDRAVDDAYEVAKSDIHYDAPLQHVVEDVELPVRLVTDAEYAATKAKVEALKKNPSENRRRICWHQDVLDRYESQKKHRFHGMELHVIRLGDVAIATNPFELFTDYGIQIKARSKALQTFVIQLAGPGTYLPTAEAVKGGGYSAIVESNVVGPEGGQVLVDRTVGKINKLWRSE